MDETRWLDEREARAWRGYQRLRIDLGAVIQDQLQRRGGLSGPDYEVLVFLSEAPEGRLRAFQLGRALRWEKSRLSHHLTRMERRGLVGRESCPTDARGYYVVLTDAGRFAIEAAAPQHVADVRRYFIDRLTPAQLDALIDIVETLVAGLSKEADEACPTDPSESPRHEVEPSARALGDLPHPLPLEPGQEPSSNVLQHVRRDER